MDRNTPEEKIPLPSLRSKKRKMKRHTITITDPETGQNIDISIPSYKRCRKSRKKKHKKIYCGDKDRLPQNYERKGTTYECLKKGYGAGLCGIFED